MCVCVCVHSCVHAYVLLMYIAPYICVDTHTHTGHHSRFHTFVSSCGNEWVFFNAAQILPCYVIQVSSTPGKRSHTSYHPPPLASLLETSHSSEPSDPQEERERKAKLLARVRKETLLTYRRHLVSIVILYHIGSPGPVPSMDWE